MVRDIIVTMLWSMSPFGEAKVGIPYGIYQGLNIYVVFAICFLANIAVFPIMVFFINKINVYFLRWNWYKRAAIWVARRAKTGSGSKIEKYGFWGLMLFVMIPIPGTGVYAGTIAASLFKMKKRVALPANVIGIFISSLIVWATTVLSMQGIG